MAFWIDVEFWKKIEAKIKNLKKKGEYPVERTRSLVFYDSISVWSGVCKSP